MQLSASGMHLQYIFLDRTFVLPLTHVHYCRLLGPVHALHERIEPIKKNTIEKQFALNTTVHVSSR